MLKTNKFYFKEHFLKEYSILQYQFFINLLFKLCVKSVKIRSFFWSVFSRIRTEYGEIRSNHVFSSNAGKYGAEKTPYMDTFHAVKFPSELNWIN